MIRAAARSARRIGAYRRFAMPIDALELNTDAVEGLMRLWTRIHWSPGDGMMPAEQLLALYKLAVTWPLPGDVVELGAWVGLTTSYLATACRVRGAGSVYAVDTFEGTMEDNASYPSVARYGGDTYAAFRQQIERAGVSDLVTPLRGPTSEWAVDYPGQPIRLLLIDADHSYAGVRSDFELWSPLVAPGGLIIFHDYLMPDVARFADEIERDYSEYVETPGVRVPNMKLLTKWSSETTAMPRTNNDESVQGCSEPEALTSTRKPRR